MAAILMLPLSCTTDKNTDKETTRRKTYDRYIANAQKHLAAKVYDSAFYYFNKAKSTCTSADEPVRSVYSLLGMAGIQQMQGDFAGSETSAVEALPFLTAKLDPVYRVSVYNQLGIVYEQQSDFDNAVKYYTLALRYTKDTLERAILKNNLAVVAIDRQDYKKAIGILGPLAANAEVIAHPETRARILDNMGLALYKANNPKGIDQIALAQKIRLQIKDDFGLTASYYHLSEYYHNTDPILARHYALESLRTATRINSADDKLEALETAIKNTKGAEASKFSLQYISLNDSLNTVRQAAKNQFAKIRYDAKKTKEENLRLRIARERAENTNKIYKIVGLFLLLFLILGYFLMRSRHNREKLEKVHKTEKMFSKKIHDELANDLYNIMAFTDSREISEANKAILLQNLNNVYLSTRDISHQASEVETGPDFIYYLKNMMSVYDSKNTNVIFSGLDELPWDKLSKNKKWAVYRVIQELLVNMKKHSGASVVLLVFELHEKKVNIRYSDNGKGIIEERIFKNGLQNVENHIGDIMGVVNFDHASESGFKLNISFPI
ncbi:MAG TPA: hypothetical protein VK528_07180 [Flavobacterium sp.]|nr:hypothetical protein [Flavobacterium sp.]